MKLLLKNLLTVSFVVMLTTNIFATKKTKELITPGNIDKWLPMIKQSYRGAINLDKDNCQIRMNTFDGAGYCQFYLGDEQYGDFRLDCVVNFSKASGKYSGLSILLRDKDGKRYWVYWRPKSRGVNALKVRSQSKTIYEYDKGKKKFTRPRSIKFNKNYTFSVELRGRRLQVFIDGKMLVDVIDPLPETYAKGKIGFSCGRGSDLTIKSVKITDLNESKKLSIKSYKYVNPPEKGDRSRKILNDNKINGKKEQALWWLATKGDPVIVFDFGKQYFVNGIKLKAQAIPSANISAYRVLSSDDGIKWKIVAGEVNSSSDSREQTQVLKAEFSTLARYIKVMLFRQAGDATIKLDEVEIMGREVRSEDKAMIKKPEKYYTGLNIPATTMKSKKDKNWFYLESGGLRVAVSRKKGNIGPVYNVAAGQRCIMLSHDSYYVETRKSAKEFSEKDNYVVKSSNKDDELILTCRNKNIKNVDIIQTYKNTKDGFSKTTELINTGRRKDLFVTVKTGAILDQKFRKNGWYLGADRGLGGRLKASEVTMSMTTTCHSPKNTKVVLFMNYGKNFGIGQFRYAINGEYCNPITSRYFEKSNHAPLYTANGWKLGLITLHLEKNKQRSVQVRWNLFAEDEFNFFKQYTSIPEVNERFNIKRPDWLLRLKTIVSDYSKLPLGKGANRDIVMHWVKRSTDLYDDGYIYNLVNAGDVWGDWYQGEKYELGWTGEKIDNVYIRKLADDLRKQSPNLKMGVYTWAWSGWAYSKTFINHPEWYISSNKNGYLKKAFQNGPMNYLRRISAPGSMEYFLSSAATTIKHFDSDFFYIDGGGGGTNFIDWKNLKIDYDTDWQKFHWGLNKATRKAKGRKRAFFTNARGAGFVDIGFLEGINNKLCASAWRDSGDAILAVKMRTSLFPKMTIIPIYWRTNTLPFYSNYCIGLGLVPENIYPSRELRNVSYVTAAYETRMLTFAPAKLVPDWRRDLETELEVYTMTHAPAAILSIINHSKLPIPQSISADAARLGINTDKPIFSWLLRMYDARKRTTGMSERTAKDVYQKSGWGVDLVSNPEFLGIAKAKKGRIEVKEKFDLNVLNIAMFSNCPAVVFAANGRRTQIWQPNARGITVNGDIDLSKRSISLTVNKNNTADVDKAELLVYIPNEWQKITVSGASLKQEVFLNKQRFLLLTVNDFDKILISAKSSEAFKITANKHLELPSVTVPGIINLKLPSGKKQITVYHNNIPVFFGNTNEIKLPEQLTSGNYTLNAIVGNTMYSGNFMVTSTWKYNYSIIKPARKKPLLQETVINRTVNGINVLKSAVNSYNGRSYPLFTQLNSDKLSFAAGCPDFITSQYGYSMAGLELEKVKVLQLSIRNTFFRHWSNYDRETRRPGNPHAFAGLMIDYHTPKGYTKRVALGMGLLQPATKAAQPLYGKKTKPDAFVRLKDYIHLSKEAKFSIDLRRWAPADWDGRVWISAAVNGGVMGGRKLFVTIIGNGDSAGDIPLDDGELVSRKLNQPELNVAKITTPVKIDGKLDDAAWGKAAKSKHFKLTSSMRKPAQDTELYMCRDKKNLYIAVKCSELERANLISDGEKIWGHDALDLSFASLPRSKKFHKFVINFQNTVFQQSFPVQGKQQKWLIKSATSKAQKTWVMEAAIPLEYLKLQNGKIAFNLLRYRPSLNGVKAFSWSLLPIEDYLKPKWFGTIKL
jgi:F5/8 type C domain-containing protein/cellulose/xylan binding protein with CBM9 domain/3-keto-disaccharide hydrolase